MADAHTNFAYATVATAPSPATSGTTLSVAAGLGALFPSAPFNATVWPANTQPLASNAEIVRVTNVAGDDFTITRATESSTARSIASGWQVAATITAKTLTDVETVADAAAAAIAAIAINPLTITTTDATTASFRYDASNRLDIAVGSTGIVDLTPAGVAARIRVGVLFEHIGANATLAQSNASDVDVSIGSGVQTGYNASLLIRAPAGQIRNVQFMSGLSPRWKIGVNSQAESGSEAGSNFTLTACVDGGGENDTVLSIARATNGTIAFSSGRPVTMGAGLTIDGTFAGVSAITGKSGGNLTITPDSGYAVVFSALLASTSALATPSALSATAFNAFASTVSGATLMGYGSTGDVTLKNRAGTSVLAIQANAQIVVVGSTSAGANINLYSSSSGTNGILYAHGTDGGARGRLAAEASRLFVGAESGYELVLAGGGDVSGSLRLGNGTLGFFGTSGQTKPTITGVASGTPPLDSLLAALATLGLITDNTT